ncbi:hypothetical protein V2J09_003790 [Rumex salicifolius]
MTKTPTNRIYIKSRLYTCKMKEEILHLDHINKFGRIISNLKDIDMNITLLFLFFLLSLPKLYENLVQILVLVRETLTMDETRTTPLVDDLRKVATSGRDNDRRKNKIDRSISKSRSLVKTHCYKCGDIGH